MSEAIPKIEGHAAFYAHLRNGHIDKARIIGLENDRFVEKILFGRKYYEAPIITSRICGICPTIHNVTSTKGIEAACNIKVSAQTKMLRKLMLCGQMIQSHSLHLYLLVLPDFVGVDSSFELQKNHPELFRQAILLKKYADEIIRVIGGRAVHPISNVPGGFKHFPSKKELLLLKEESKAILETARKTTLLFNSFRYPKVKRNILFSALTNKKDYAYYDGAVTFSNSTSFEAVSYKKYIYEELKPYTRAKFATLRGKEYMVGACARINKNRKHLNKNTHSLITEIGFKHHLDNPFDNIMAQAIENHFFVNESIELIDQFIKDGLDRKDPVKPPREYGSGVSACEAPRGTLFHYYELDGKGNIVNCDLITPTVQNLSAMEFDLKKLGDILTETPKSEQKRIIEMFIRAYDPCITCATH